MSSVAIDQGPFELGPQGMPLELPLGRCPSWTREGLVHMREKPHDDEKKQYDAMSCHQYCAQGLPKISTSSSISTSKQKQFGTTSKCLRLVLNSQKKIENLSCTMSLSDSRCFSENINDTMFAFHKPGQDAVDASPREWYIMELKGVGSANPQVGPSNASILSEVHILENAIDHSISNQDEHEGHNKVQPSDVIDTTSVHMGNSNVTPYEQYLSDNDIFGVPSCASSALSSVCVSPVNDAFVLHDPIATELKIYKEQVAIYEQRAKFELTEHEQRMDDQIRMLIQNHNKMEENLKKELHSFKLQLKSTMENNKIIEETVTTLKQEFKQKESKFLTDFSNLKHLNDKLKNKLHSQDQSIQTVHMMLNPTQVYDQKTKTVLGAQNPFYLRQAKRAQPALYDGDELLKPHHVPVIVSTSEEELELAEATRNKLHVKMNDLYLAKRKAKELKANATPLPVLPPATVYPPNTPAHLVPRTLPTTSQVNIGLFSTAYAFTSAQKCIADLESENFNLRNKIQNDDHDSMIKHFSKLKVEHFNLQLKYQHLKESFGNKKPVTSSDAPSFDSLFVIGKLNEQIQSQGNTIHELREKISRLTKKNSDADPIFDLKALVSQNKDLTAKLNALHDLNECFRAENAKVKQHYKELYDSIKITRTKTTDQNNSLLSEIEHLKDQLKENSKCVTIPDCKPKVLAPGVKGASAASRSKPRSNTKKDRTLPAKSALKQVEAHSRMNKSHEKHKNHVDSSISYKRTWPLTRNTPPKVLPTQQWKTTGRLPPLGKQCPLVKSTALKSDCLPADPQEPVAPVAYNLACTNQPDPNCNWGSNVSNSSANSVPFVQMQVVQTFLYYLETLAAQNIYWRSRFTRLRNFGEKVLLDCSIRKRPFLVQ
ncbi:hypothetical protein Tco_0748956 [Tanacetum coccineum]|uniref:Uncharacterized protein n=1 Tax=Tanacetum coccineum TaxID=301880 RepID=A0ABQ4YY13_9ASTR